MNGYACPACTAFIFTNASEPRRDCGNCGASTQTQQIAKETRLMRNLKGDAQQNMRKSA